MTIWFSSDHHFGHTNIIKYCERPFNSVAHMNAAMIGAWNGVVAPDDTVYYLGDFAMQPKLVAEILPQLNGTKILIAGNHDRCHPKIGNPDRFLHLHHFPYRTETEPKQKYYGQRPIDRGSWLIHGHVHHRWRVSGRQINVSVENWNFEPVSLDKIVEIIEDGPQPSTVTRTYD